MLRPSRTAVCLGLILLLGVAARVPGLFWGYRFFGTELVVLHGDEPYYTVGHGPGSGFPQGLSVNVRVLGWTLRHVGLASVTEWGDWWFFAGRLVSLLYGVLTILVVYRLARAFFKDERVGLLAAFFLAVADLHVTYSHIGTPDSAAAFWFYAALASAHTGLERGSRIASVLAAVCAGASGAMRFQFMSVLPLAWCVVRDRAWRVVAPLLAAAVATSFFVLNGFDVSPSQTLQIFTMIGTWGDLGWKRLLLPVVHLAVILVGVGLPVFVLAGYGVIRLIRAKRQEHRSWRGFLADDQIVLCLAPLGAILQLSLVTLWAHRHAVVLVPFVAMLAAFGFAQLSGRGLLSTRWATRALLLLVGIHLAVHVASVQAYFVDDPLEKAGRWLRAHVAPGEVLSSFAAPVPPEYPVIAEWKANYLILSARGYRRYLFKDFLPSRVTGRLVTPEDVAVRRIYNARIEDLERLQKLFRSELPYRLVKTIRLRFVTPELLLTNALWYPPPHLDEVLIYERQRERERTVKLLTPSLTDYLVTLHMGKTWRVEPGPEVRLAVNGEPLPVQLREGTVHFVLPRALVVSAFSELRLASDRLLPHLPLDFVQRVRPLGGEFVVESLLDEDLLPDGFSEPEIDADGGAWRWTTGVGQVLLPGTGSSGPWRRLAVHVAGRPGGPRSQPVVLFLNARKIGDARISTDARTLEFALPPDAFDGGVGTLEIMAPTRVRSAADGRDETRRVGVAVYWVRLTRAERFQPFDQPVAGLSLPRAWRPLFGLGVPYRVEPVSFPSDNLTLRGDLFVPPGGGRSAIVLAHGAGVLGRKHGLYLGLARRLAGKGYWVLLPDFRGYGESERPARIAAPRDLDFTRDLAAAVGYLERRLGVKDVVVVGHSFGADVGIALAARDPRVAKLVAISPARRVFQRLFNRPGGTRWMRDRLAAEMGLGPEQVPLELMEPVMVPITIDTYLDHAFRQPVLLVDGEVEEEADLRFLRAVYRRLKAEKAYVTIPKADHYFGVLREVEERDAVTLDALADVVDGWIREGARWSRPRD